MVRLALREVRPRAFHLKGKHNQRSHGGGASTVPDVTDTVTLKDAIVAGRQRRGEKVPSGPGEVIGWKGQTDAKVKWGDGSTTWEDAPSLQVVKKGVGIGDEDSSSILKGSNFRELKTDKDFQEWAQKQPTPKLTAAERRSVSEYIGNEYGETNAQLRERTIEREYRPLVRSIDSALSKSSPLSEDLVVYRGLDTQPGWVSRAKAGAEFRDAAFMSTSLSRSVAEGFSSNSGALLKINLPKGTPSLFTGKLGIGEGELLLPRDSSFRVVKATKNRSGRYEIEITFEKSTPTPLGELQSLTEDLHQFHLKGKHNQKSHGGHASSIPDVTDTLRVKGTQHTGTATEYQNYKGEDWLKLDTKLKGKAWHKAHDLEVVSKGVGIGNDSTGKTAIPDQPDAWVDKKGKLHGELRAVAPQNTLALNQLGEPSEVYFSKTLQTKEQRAQAASILKVKDEDLDTALHELTGGMKDAKHRVSVIGEGEGAYIRVGSRVGGIGADVGADSERRIRRTSKGLEIENYSIELRGMPPGTGTAVFSNQVLAAKKHGATAITADMSRANSLNGYYTWPRLGYNANVTGPNGPTTLHELMRTVEGRTWWKQNGVSTEGRFDLTDDSSSMKILQAYATSKGVWRGSGTTTSGSGTGRGTAGSSVGSVRLPGGGTANVLKEQTFKGEVWVQTDAPGKKKWFLKNEVQSSDSTAVPKALSATPKSVASLPPPPAPPKSSGGFEGTFKPVTTHERWKTKKELAADPLSRDAQNLTTFERKAVEKYTAAYTDTYEKINKNLRAGKENWALPQLDKALDRSRLAENLLLRRGTYILPDQRDALGIKEGAVFTDKGYISTTLRSGSVGFGPWTVFSIKARKGSRGLYVQSISQSQGEHEVLLPRGSKFRIVRIRQNPDNDHPDSKLVEMEYLDDGR